MAERERWTSRQAFVLAAVGSAVGLGNVWRFPYVAYANGGGAFFIPYFVALVTAGIPLLILELGLGQMMQSSAPGSLKKANPHGEWVGWFALLVGTVISFYYAVIMAYSWEYLAYSFNFTMPWSTAEATAGKIPEAVFFGEKIRNDFTQASEMWYPVLGVAIGLLLTWGAVFLITCKGVRRVSKVVWVTVPLPWILLVILTIRGLTLEGAGDGIAYYLSPDFDKLKEPSTWLAAYGQVFFSLTLGFGVMIAYASYLPKRSDIANNSFIIGFANCMTSFFAGFAVFSVLGFLAFSLKKPVGDVAAAGPGLAFVTYPRAISMMPTWCRPIVAVSFFIMLLTLGIDSLFSLVEGVVTGLRDRWPWMTNQLVAGFMCTMGFLVGLFVFGNRAGIRWLDIFDHWANDYGLVVVGLLQCVVVGYLYDTDRLRDHINDVSEVNLWGWWELCVKLLTPVALVYLIGANFIGELTRANLYGAGAAGDPFNSFLWVAPVAFACLFVIAFALARNWEALVVSVSGAAVFLFLWAYFKLSGADASGGFVSPAILGAVGTALLVGGLVICIRIAMRAPTQAVMAALAAGERLSDLPGEDSLTPVEGLPATSAVDFDIDVERMDDDLIPGVDAPGPAPDAEGQAKPGGGDSSGPDDAPKSADDQKNTEKEE